MRARGLEGGDGRLESVDEPKPERRSGVHVLGERTQQVTAPPLDEERLTSREVLALWLRFAPRLDLDQLAARIAPLLEPVAEDDPRGDVVGSLLDALGERVVPAGLRSTCLGPGEHGREPRCELVAVEEELDHGVALEEPALEIDPVGALDHVEQLLGERRHVVPARELELARSDHPLEHVRHGGEQLRVVHVAQPLNVQRERQRRQQGASLLDAQRATNASTTAPQPRRAPSAE
jgi:hypothetical protein